MCERAGAYRLQVEQGGAAFHDQRAIPRCRDRAVGYVRIEARIWVMSVFSRSITDSLMVLVQTTLPFTSIYVKQA